MRSGHGGAGGVEVMRQAFAALRHMGFGETETKRALAGVRSHVGREGTLEEVVRAALGVLTEGLGAAM